MADGDLAGVGDGALTCAYALQKVRGISLRSDAWITVAAGERTRPLALDDVRRRFARQSRLLIVGGTGMTLVGAGYVAALFLP